MESVVHRAQLKTLASTLAGDKLEISPAFAPILDHSRSDVHSVAVLTREEQCACIERDPKVSNSKCHNVPETDYVLRSQDGFSIASVIGERRFVLVVSSHTLEHTTSLIGHLNDAYNALAPGGCYVAWVPDCRYCFDRDRFPTTIADVIEDFYLKGTRHKLSSVVASRIFHAHNNPGAHWRAVAQTREGMTIQSIAVTEQKISHREITREVIDDWVSSGKYVDCHNYQLTPEIFKSLFSMLRRLEYLPQDFKIIALHPTAKNSHEFCFCARKGD